MVVPSLSAGPSPAPSSSEGNEASEEEIQNDSRRTPLSTLKMAYETVKFERLRQPPTI